MKQARAVSDFEEERPRLFSVAYRMLGSITEAEDVLQDAYLRWARLSGAARRAIANPAGYLVRIVTRLCIDARRSAHARRMTYVGPWLPEPLLGQWGNDLVNDPSDLHELADDLSVGFLVMLERLGPVERAVLLLREAFDFEYKEIAAVVGKTEENCRQIERRARMRLKAPRRRDRGVDRRSHERLLRRFLDATRGGDVDGLLAILAEDVVAYADGGGKAVAARRPVAGAIEVARYLTGLVRLAPAGFEILPMTVNGEPGLVTYIDGRLRNVVSISARDGLIDRIFITVNPDKLAVAEATLHRRGQRS